MKQTGINLWLKSKNSLRKNLQISISDVLKMQLKQVKMQ